MKYYFIEVGLWYVAFWLVCRVETLSLSIDLECAGESLVLQGTVLRQAHSHVLCPTSEMSMCSEEEAC